jgi:hypothetical protein
MRAAPHKEKPLILEGESMVNTMYVYRDGVLVLVGDAAGLLNTWDVRAG